MSAKLFHFAVRNDRTLESIQFYGQGDGVEAAFKDAMKILSEAFRPKNDGKQRDANTGGVLLPDGRRVSRTLKDFESDTPYDAKLAQPNPNIFELEE